MRRKPLAVTVPVFLLALFAIISGQGQCPFSAPVTASNVACGSGLLTVSPGSTAEKIVWYKDGVAVKTSIRSGVVITTVAGGNGYGAAANQLANPAGIWLDPSLNVFVADFANNRIQEWVQGATSGTTVAGGNGPGSALNQFNGPEEFMIDPNGVYLISDQNNNRIMAWSQGAWVGVSIVANNGYGSASNQLANAEAVVRDPAGTSLYVADENNNRIQQWKTTMVTGITVAGGNGAGAAANQLDKPTDIKIGPDGNFYIADFGNNRIQMWVPGATSGTTVAGGNGAGSAANQLSGPTQIFIDNARNIYIADKYNNRVQMWVPGAASGVTVAGGNGMGSAMNQLSWPIGVSVDGYGAIYVSDYNNNRVQKWTNGIDLTYNATAPGNYTAVVTDVGGCTSTSNVMTVGGPPTVSIASTGSDCEGATLQASTTAPDLQQLVWYNGITQVKTGNAPDLAYGPAAAGVYTLKVTTQWGCTATTNPVTIEPSVTPGVSVNASITAICAGTPVVFTATPTNGGVTPGYQWQINGQNYGPGSTNPVLSDGNLPSGNINVSVVMTSNADCPSTKNVTSLPVAMTVTPLVTPMVNITTSATEICQGQSAEFTATPTNAGASPTLMWEINGGSTGQGGLNFSSSTLKDGDAVSVMATGFGQCSTTSIVYSNPITMHVLPTAIASVVVSAYPSSAVCSNDQVQFSAQVTNGGNTPSYQWLLDGNPVGTDSPDYTDTQPVAGDLIVCEVTNDPICPAGVSNSVPLSVYPTPVIAPGQVVDMVYGQDGTLDPQVTGSNLTYSWAPATGLSDPTIRNPIADPTATTTYTLTVTTAQGCTAVGDIVIKVRPAMFHVPGAFSPNGDGKNDIFYVLGGPLGSVVKSFVVFDRWGQCVFQVHDAPTGDPAYGWNGNINGQPAEQGTYVYAITVKSTTGTVQQLKGSVIIVR